MYRTVARLFVFILLVVTGASFALANDDAGRIVNTIAHLGGDKLIERADGYHLVNQFGEELWFFPIAEVNAALIESALKNACIELEPGQGTYGPATLHATAYQGMGVTLRFSGMDEHGKWNTFYFNPGGTDTNWQPLTSVMGPDGNVLAPTFGGSPAENLCPNVTVGMTVGYGKATGMVVSVDGVSGTAQVAMYGFTETLPCADLSSVMVVIETRES